jgi:type IV pilus assembly protein PilA
MKRRGNNRARAGFTLLELMLIVATIGLLAALAVPAFVKVRKQSQGRRVVNDARQLDAAIEQWAVERNRMDGDPVNTTEAAIYLRSQTWIDNDVLNNPYVINNVGTNQIQVSPVSKSALSSVAVDWGPY